MGFPTDRINVTKRIGCSHLAVCIRVVDNRCEEIDGLYKGLSGTD